jgi:hypothetical protein
MEVQNATYSDSLEVVSTFGSSDELNFMIMQEKEKTIAKGDQTVESSRTSQDQTATIVRSKVIKDGAEKPHRNKSAMNKGVKSGCIAPFFASSPSAKRTNSGTHSSSPGGTASGSEVSVSEEDRPENTHKEKLPRSLSMRARRGVDLMKNFLRKARSQRVPRNIEAVGTDAILRDLDLQSINSTGTRTVRHSNTKKIKRAAGDSDPPAILLKRAGRYKKKAQRLLREAGAIDSERKRVSKKLDTRDIEALARKAFRYAAESRRLFDLAYIKRAKELLEQSPSATTSEPCVNYPEDASVMSGTTKSEKSKTAFESGKKTPDKVECTASMIDDDDTVVTVHTTFSQKVERDEHKRKMKELELFENFYFGPIVCGSGGGLGLQYTDETKRIVHSLHDTSVYAGDNLSIMTPVSIKSSETTESERVARKEHLKKMKELELFSLSTPAEMWKEWLQSFSTKKYERAVAPNTSRVDSILDDEDDNYSEDSSLEESVEASFGGLCSHVKYEDLFADDLLEEETEGDDTGLLRSVDEDDDLSDDLTDKADELDDDNSKGSNGDSDDASLESDRQGHRGWFDIF